MLLTKHELTEGEKKCLEEYEREKSPKPRKNLIRLVRHMNFANPLPNEKSWEYIFFDRQLNDAQVDFALKMKLRHPYTIKELATVEKMSVEDTAQMAYDLCYIGLLEYFYVLFIKNRARCKSYFATRPLFFQLFSSVRAKRRKNRAAAL